MKVNDWFRKYIPSVGGILIDPPDRQRGLWDSLTREVNDSRLSLSGIRPSSSDLPYAVDAAPRDVGTAELLAIQQRRSLGLDSVDIFPFHVPTTTFPLTIPYLQLIAKVGHDGDGDTLTTPSTFVLKSWCTVPIQRAGNFLRMDFLPAKMNRLEPSGVSAGQPLYQFHEDQSYSSRTPGNNAPSQSPESKADTNNWYHREGRTRMVLVQFDDPNGAIHILRHGDICRIPFNTAYVSFKTGCAPFSITTGYNTELVSTQDQRMGAMNLALAPGHGMFEWPNCHAVPWTSNCNVYATGTQADQWKPVAGSGFPSMQNNTVVSDHFIIVNQANTSAPNAAQFGGGIAVVWVSRFTGRAIIETSALGNMRGVFTLYKASDNTAGLKVLANGMVLASQNQLSAVGEANFGGDRFEYVFDPPIRVVLKAGQYLAVRPDFQTSTAGINYRFFYEVHGYSWGDLIIGSSGSGNALGAGIPVQLTTHPYPMDMAEANRV